MATIVALCPYCRRGGVRAPERSIGSITTCSKCGSQFTIVPKEQAEDLTPGPIEEAQPTPPPAETTTPIAAVALEPAANAPADRDAAFSLSLTAFTLFGLGVVATQFPFGRFIGLGVCGVGLLLGLGCLLAEGRARKLGAAAAALNATSVVMLALLPGWLGFIDPSSENNPAMPKGPHSIALSTNDVTASERTDASRAVYANADVRIAVRTAVHPFELVGPSGATRRTRENVLVLTITITNAGVERRIPLTDWAAGRPGELVKLADPSTNALKLKALDAGWRPNGVEAVDGVFPGKSAEVVLLFEPPSIAKGKRLEYLNLDLPGVGVGLVEPIRFKLPGTF